MHRSVPAPFTVAPLQSAGGAARIEDARARSIYVWLALAISASYIFEGPLRYVLLLAKIPTAIYLRDLASVAMIAFAVFCWMTGERRLFPLVVALYVLFLHLLCGVLLLPSVIQPLLGLKVFFTFLFGMAAAASIAEHPRTLQWLALTAFFATAAGVFLDAVVDFPWAGEAYESAIATVQVSREWSSGGIPRLAGFARASFDAATIVLVLMVPMLATRWSVLWRAALWALGFVTIWLTTSKGALLALLALAVWRALENLRAPKRCVITWVSASAAICLAMPLAATQLGFTIRRGSVVSWLSSFMERVDFMWPDAMQSWLKDGYVLVGRGLGGIGFGQLGAEWWRYNAADNLMIYLLVSFGLLALVYIAAFLAGLARTFDSGPEDAYFARCVRGWAVVLFSYGCTSNMVEQPLMNLVIGVCFGAVTILWPALQSQTRVSLRVCRKAVSASVAAGAVLFASPGHAQTAFQFGVGVHVGQNRNALQATEKALAQTGVNSFRDEVFWHRIETRQGTLAFPDSLRDLDQLVTDSVRQGRRPLLILNYGNRFYDGGGLLSSLEGIAAYTRYVRFVVKHFRGRVDQFEVWNEWNIGGGGTPQQRAARSGSPEGYAAVLRAAYAAIKAENPAATVIGGAFAGYDAKWVEAFARAGGFASLDGFSMHPYVFAEGRQTPVAPSAVRLSGAIGIDRLLSFFMSEANADTPFAPLPATPESAMKHLDEFKSRIDQLAPGRNVRIYVTEAGWPVHNGSHGVSEAVSAAYLQRFMLLARARPWIAGVWWYDLFDDGDNAQDKEHRFGLLTKSGAPKPAFQALADIQSLLASSAAPALETDGSGQITVSGQRADGTRFVASWLATDDFSRKTPWPKGAALAGSGFRSLASTSPGAGDLSVGATPVVLTTSTQGAQ